MIETLCTWKSVVDDALHEIFDPLHLPGVGKYWHVMLASYLVFYMIKLGSRPVSQMVLPRIYGQFDAKTKQDWDVAVTALIHTVFDSVVIGWYLFEGSLATDRMDGYNETFEFLLAVMQGYYIWDLVICVTSYSVYGLPYLIHAGLGVLGLLILTSRQLQFYAIPYLLPEVSSVFLNIRHLLKYAGKSGSLAYKVNFAVFTVAFVVIRLGYEAYYSYVLAVDVYNGDVGNVYKPFAMYFTALGVTLTCLNVMWFREVLVAAYYTLAKSPKSKTAESKKTQ
ncbi:hypothetical protein FBU59_002001 [Linderina macrospora]|uniref:Uncharacterized protein n=1 Tax=Linderina macrospora TaxID=4868 RepID=A0ACC1JCK8_9FUNG|nr:hypothetical protein FBU59_002001 [Linderina macrospora]